MIDDILAKLHGVTKTSSGWSARCPAHEDHNASLSVAEGRDGKVLVHCHAGCVFVKIRDAMGLPQAAFGPPPPPKAPKAQNREVARYSYHDETGQLQFFVVRYEPKDFRQCRPARHDDPPDTVRSDGCVYKVNGVRKIPYQLPQVVTVADSGGIVIVCEGEKDCDAINSRAAAAQPARIATCNAGGAGKWLAAYSQYLRGAHVVVIADKDQPGRKHGQEVAKTLVGIAAEIRVIELPDLNGSAVKDAADFLNAGGTVDQILELADATSQWAAAQQPAADKSDDRPIVHLPDNSAPIPVQITDAATRLGRLLAVKQEVFNRVGVLVRVEEDNDRRCSIRDVTPACLQSEFEAVARLATTRQVGANPPKIVDKWVFATKAQAEAIAAARCFGAALPPLCLVTPCPVMVRRRDGQLAIIRGYDLEAGIYASGGEVPQVPLDEAVALLLDVVGGFRFATDGDRSRAVASLVTPALVHGNLLAGRAPLDLGESNDSQSGKGYRAKGVAAIYRDTPVPVTQRERGVGSMEETFSSALLAGKTFISLDNIRGPIGSTGIESALTEDHFIARAPYRAPVVIDMQRVVVMMTSNRAELNIDLANRASLVRILKQPEGHHFRTYANGRDILGHVRANQPLYLGAVFSVVRAWFEAGSPRTAETRHDFRPWAQSLDWIVQNVFHLAPLCDGLRETKARMISPVLSWLRTAALALLDAGLGNRWLRTAMIVEALDERGCDIPGAEGSPDLTDSTTASRVNQATGRRLAQCFKHADTRIEDGHGVEALTIDSMTVLRKDEYCLALQKDVKVYRVFRPTVTSADAPPIAERGEGTSIGGTAVEHCAPHQSAAPSPPERGTSPAYTPPMENLLPPIPPNGPDIPPVDSEMVSDAPLTPQYGEVTTSLGGIGGRQEPDGLADAPRPHCEGLGKEVGPPTTPNRRHGAENGGSEASAAPSVDVVPPPVTISTGTTDAAYREVEF